MKSWTNQVLSKNDLLFFPYALTANMVAHMLVLGVDNTFLLIIQGYCTMVRIHFFVVTGLKDNRQYGGARWLCVVHQMLCPHRYGKDGTAMNATTNTIFFIV
jgi:hypothetical protein